jgi:hypothetical protein
LLKFNERDGWRRWIKEHTPDLPGSFEGRSQRAKGNGSNDNLLQKTRNQVKLAL